MSEELANYNNGEVSAKSFEEIDTAKQIADLQQRLDDLRKKPDFGPDDSDEVRFLEEKLDVLKSQMLPKNY